MYGTGGILSYDYNQSKSKIWILVHLYYRPYTSPAPFVYYRPCTTTVLQALHHSVVHPGAPAGMTPLTEGRRGQHGAMTTHSMCQGSATALWQMLHLGAPVAYLETQGATLPTRGCIVISQPSPGLLLLAPVHPALDLPGDLHYLQF